MARDNRKDRSPLIAVGVLICLAVAFGGGGVRYGLANLVVQIGALIILALNTAAVTDFWKTAPLSLRILITISVLLPTVQLVPLPESLWKSLPGRDLVQQSFALTGKSGWAPMSVDPVRTAVALTGMIVPLTVIMVGWALTRAQLLKLGWLIVALGMINVVIGIPQALQGGLSFEIFPEPGPDGILYGTFANRNSTGLFLVAALSFAAILPTPKPHSAALPIRLAICALLFVAILLTRSRTALVLVAIPALLTTFRALWWHHRNKQNRASPSIQTSLVVFGPLALGLGVMAAIVVVAPGRVGDTIERFDATSDARTHIWEDSGYAASRYWPVGAGMGAFDEVIQVDESLENATERRAGRAHNDFLEVAIEAGIAGIALIAFWLLAVLWFAWQAQFSKTRWAAWAGGAILIAVALQSITDYPLRNQSMLAVASFAFLLLARIGSRSAEGKP
ncbi:O-antigen ligase family protein [Erythrobacter sp. F6033]|uniref:O-antigen ligase family protein n=1 Tax=Erythrobacter sp. F6033 TaxID=2926401 RepID=UPI001FF26278|nr:O-antigen ligase family protein [Erythrobacter sp. F6033]MCK0127176.1 O-antigen ligase family protein [Erythrobacter sp. F6033]